MSTHHHKHHHRHSIWYRMRRWVRHNKGLAAGSAVIVAVVAVGAGTVLYRSYQSQSQMHVTAGNAVDMKGGYRTRTWDGKEYQYNAQITNILYAELDSEGKLEAEATYGGKAKAETLTLFIMDKKNQKINVLTLDGETVAQMHQYDSTGKDLGVSEGVLKDAYSYGDGGEVSCENLVNAVETLLGDITINEYVVANRSSKTEIHALADGLMAYMGEFADLMQKDPNMAVQEEQIMRDNLQTSITRNKYQSLAETMDQTSEGIMDYYQLQGERRSSGTAEMFYPDEQQLEQMIINLFYEEV